jgi:poly(A) polymerase
VTAGGASSAAPIRLDGAAWLINPATQAVFSALSAAGIDARAVGGAVRNSLLGEPVSDIDLATPATPQSVMQAAQAAGLRAIATGLDHGTVTIISGHRPYEVTTLRRDVETFGRHATVAFTTDWAEDASRRDFTMNALYCGADGTVYDPLSGFADVQARRVRFIGEAQARIREDYLRILRFFRFMAQYGAIELDREGLAACMRERRGLDVLSGERVRQELVRLIVAPGAGNVVGLMFDHGLLTELTALAPRPRLLDRLIAIDGDNGYAPDAMLRLAVLLVEIPEDAARLADRLRVSNAERDVLAAASLREMRQAPGPSAVSQRIYRRRRELVVAELMAAWVLDLSPASNDADWAAAVAQAQSQEAPLFRVTGADVMARGVAAGTSVGVILRAVEQRWIEGNFTANRDELLWWLDEEIASRSEGK